MDFCLIKDHICNIMAMIGLLNRGMRLTITIVRKYWLILALSVREKSWLGA